MKKLFVGLIPIFLLLAAEVQAANTYWTRPTGTMSGCVASSTAPAADSGYKATIAAGRSCLAGGDTLNIRTGTYAETIDNAVQANIPSGTSYATATTIQAFGSEIVTLQPTSGDIIIRIASPGTGNTVQFVIFKNLILSGVNQTGSVAYGVSLGGGFNGGAVQFIKFDGVEIKNIGRAGIEGSGMLLGGDDGVGNNLWVTKMRVHDGGNPSPFTGIVGLGHCWYIEGSNTLIEYSECYNWQAYGIHNYAQGTNTPSNNTYRYNYIHDVGLNTSRVAFGILLSVGNGNKAYDNIVANNQNGIAADPGNFIFNNTLYGNGQGFGGVCCYEAISVSASTVQNNILFNNAVNAILNTGGATSNNFTSDPQFVNATAGNFRLQSTSPAIDKVAADVSASIGCTAGSTCVDFDGAIRPQGTGWDVGAFEFVASSIGAKTYWVSTTGNNANSCQSASGGSDPGVYKRDWTGPSGGISCMAPGDTLKIKGGTYSEYLRYDISGLTLPNGTSDTARITIQRSAADQAVILRAPRTFPSNVAPVNFFGQQYWTLDGITVDCENFITGGGCYRSENSTNMQFINGEIKNAATTCFLGGGAGDKYISNKVHDCDLNGASGNTPPEHGMYVSASNVLVEKNDVYNTGGWGIHVFDQNTSVNNVTVRGNTVHNFGTANKGADGILLARGTNNLAYNNLVYQGTGANGMRIGLCLAGCTGSALYNNTIYNVTQGIQLDTNIGVLVKNNIISSSGNPPISDTGSGTSFATNLCDVAGTGCTTPPGIGSPSFVSPGVDFRLQSGSLAAGTGTNLASIFTTDINGVNRASWDIGAYAFIFTTPNAVLLLSFDETAGSTSQDSSGFNNNGSFTTGVTHAPGKYNNGLSFDGVTGQVTVLDATSLSVPNAFTIEAWVNPVSVSATWRALLTELDGAFFFVTSVGSACGNSALYGGFVNSLGAVQRVCYGTPLTANVLTHIAITYDGAILTLYVNGSSVATQAATGAIQARATNPLIANSGAGELFGGIIDELRAYNYARTAAQIIADRDTKINPLGIIQPPIKLFASTAAIKCAPSTACLKLSGNP